MKKGTKVDTSLELKCENGIWYIGDKHGLLYENLNDLDLTKAQMLVVLEMSRRGKSWEQIHPIIDQMDTDEQIARNPRSVE